MVALYYGYDKGFMQENSREDIRKCLQAFAIISILLSLIGAIRSLMNQSRVAFTQWTQTVKRFVFIKL